MNSQPPRFARPSPAHTPGFLDQRLLAPRVAIVVLLVAMVIGYNTPGWFPPGFLDEDGPVETANVWLYLLTVPLLLLADVPELKWPDRLALVVLMLAFAAREADLHKAMFGMSILKARFYTTFASPAQIAIALGMLLPIIGSAVWLIKRHAARWRSAMSSWSAVDVTIVTFIVSMVATKCFDRLPETLIDTHVFSEVPTVLRHILLGAEEVLELALPLLAMLAVVQARAAQRAWLRSS